MNKPEPASHPKTRAVMLRVPPDLFEFLHEDAYEEMRSLNAQIVQILKHHRCAKERTPLTENEAAAYGDSQGSRPTRKPNA